MYHNNGELEQEGNGKNKKEEDFGNTKKWSNSKRREH